MKDKNNRAAAKIKEFRIAKGISQNTLAKNLNLTVTAYSRLENSKTQLSINMLFAIATALDISVTDLLDLSSDNPKHDTNTLVIADFYNGSLHVTINAEEFKKRLSVK